jgi:hypothetical protein
MTRRKFAVIVSLFIGVFSVTRTLAEESVPAPTPAATYALGFTRGTRLSVELHRSLGSSIAEKKQGTGVGFGYFFSLDDSNWDLGFRYVYVKEAKDPDYVDGPNAFTLLTFVFDFYVWPTKLGGLFVGGEIGVTDPATNDFFSFYSDYAFVAKFGYELNLPGKHWSAAFEARRSVRDPDPLKATRESHQYSNDLSLGFRYRI